MSDPGARARGDVAERRGALAAVLAAYFVLGVVLLPGSAQQINPDGTAYLAGARKYLAGHFADAATGFWSPLYTWLLTAPLALGVPPLLAAKLVDLLAGAAAVVGAWRLLIVLGVGRRLRLAAVLTLVPVVLSFGLSVVTPDLLSCAIVLHFLADVSGPAWWSRPRGGARIGLLMGFAFLAKAYALGFVVVHFALTTSLDLWRARGERYRIGQGAAAALAALLVIAGSWSAALSVKYGRPMISSAGTLNWGYDGPNAPGYPMQRGGFLSPPDLAALSAWDDPTFMSLPGWDPLGSPRERAHMRSLVLRNLADLRAILRRFSALAAVVLAAALLLAGSRVDPPPRRPALILVLATLVYPSAYIALHMRDRYLCVLCVLLLVLGAFAVDALGGWLEDGHRWRARLAAAALCASFLWTPVQVLRSSRGDGRQWAVLAGSFASVPAGARVASNGRWRQSLYLSFHRGWRYFGEPAPDSAPATLPGELQRHAIEYFVVWGDPRTLPFLAAWPEVARGPGGPRVYRVPDAVPGGP